MLDHVSIAVGDLARAVAFYDAALGALGVPRVWIEDGAAGYGVRNHAGDDGHGYLTIRCGPVTAAGMCHWAFRAPDRAAVDAFHAAALAAGGTDAGAPGPRPEYHEHYYGAFALDPDGNRVEAVCHRAP